MSQSMLPDKTSKCHRTGFQETCFRCVVEHGCKLWIETTFEFNPESGQANFKVYECKDKLDDIYAKDTMKRLSEIRASIDQLRTEVQHANDTGMANALMGINREMRRLAGHQTESVSQIASEAPLKMLGHANSHANRHGNGHDDSRDNVRADAGD